MEDSLEESRENRLQKKLSMLVTILLILAVVLCLYTSVQVLSKGYVNIGGFMMFRVVTGSMEPTIPVGALLLSKQTEIEHIQVNDIVCFRTQAAQIWGKIVTHRVVGISETGMDGILLETKGDANLVADGFFVESSNLVGKVIWHTGDGSMLANLLSLLTSKVGFLGCIVLPTLLIATLILKDSVSSIRQELQYVLEMEQQQATSWENDPLCGMTQEEYNEMYERIRAELMEELMHFAEIQKGKEFSSESTETETGSGSE